MKRKLIWIGLLVLAALCSSNAGFAQSLTVTAGGPSQVRVWGSGFTNVTWTSTASNGVAPYTYKWYFNGILAHTGQNFPASIYGSNTESVETMVLTVVVQDKIGQTGTASKTTVVYRYHIENDCGQLVCPER